MLKAEPQKAHEEGDDSQIRNPICTNAAGTIALQSIFLYNLRVFGEFIIATLLPIIYSLIYLLSLSNKIIYIL